MVGCKVLNEVVLYGAGVAGKRLHSFLRSRGIRVTCFLDRRAAGIGSLDGVPVYAPEEARVDRSSQVIISIFNHVVPVRPIIEYLNSLGFERCLPYVQFHAGYSKELGDDFWLTDRTIIKSHNDDILRAEALFEDDVSRQVFQDVLRFRETADFASEPQPDVRRQYFPADIPGWLDIEPLRFLDCGAYNGDTLAVIQRLKIPLDAVGAFEPDPENFAALAEYCRSALSSSVTVALWQTAVSDTHNFLMFQTGEGDASKVTSGGTSHVQSVALDNVAYGLHPNMIKMDVEGFEIHALRGARKILQDFRPRLAVSVYHTPFHHWEIPLLLASWCPDYKMYVRSHGYQTFDTVLYAVPR